jgi:hypothetical protein
MNYLLETLKAGESWRYQPPAGHTVGWLAVAKGTLQADTVVRTGDMVVLHHGNHSVHTPAEALQTGERRIERCVSAWSRRGAGARAPGTCRCSADMPS